MVLPTQGMAPRVKITQVKSAHTFSSDSLNNATIDAMAGMGGDGFTYTPTLSGNLLIMISFNAYGNGGVEASFDAFYGTGAAPAQNANQTGAKMDKTTMLAYLPAGVLQEVSMVIVAVASLNTNTAYWFDVGFHPITGISASIDMGKGRSGGAWSAVIIEY